MLSPTYREVQLVGRADRRANKDRCMGWVGKRNMRQLVHAHPRSNGYCCHLSDVDRPFSDDVTAYDFAGLAVGKSACKSRTCSHR